MENNKIIATEASILKRIGLIGVGLSLWIAHPSIGWGQSSPPGNEERINPAGVKADLKIIVLDRFGRMSGSDHHFYKAGTLVRVEPQSSGPVDSDSPDAQRQIDPSEDIYIYDYLKRKQYRLVPSSQIYFETVISQPALVEAQREGWIPLEVSSNVETKKLKLAEAAFDGHPCLLYLQVRSLMAGAGGPKQKKKRIAVEYSLHWEATDLENLPVRIVYTGPDYTTKIVEYRNVRSEHMDAALFQPPKNFRGLSPF